MQTMKDIPYPPIGSPIKGLMLSEDLLLDDSAFSDKPLQIARKGETIFISCYENYGLVQHPIHGIFRY